MYDEFPVYFRQKKSSAFVEITQAEVNKQNLFSERFNKVDKLVNLLFR
jgi:hypothetical protein